MTELNPPSFMQNRADENADQGRMLLAALAVEGVVGTGDLAVTEAGTPDMSVLVAAGAAFVAGDESATQGSYHCHSDGEVSRAIIDADSTNPRIDIVVAQVLDSFYSGATDAWQIAVVTGVAASAPVEPALPANAIKLAVVDVAAGATSITNADITDTRTVAVSKLGLDLAAGKVTGTLAQWNAALSDADFASLAGAETLTNKTLTSPTINAPQVNGGTLSGVTVNGASSISTSVAGGIGVSAGGACEIILGFSGSGGLSIAQAGVATHSNGVVLWVSGNSLYARHSNGTDSLIS